MLYRILILCIVSIGIWNEGTAQYSKKNREMYSSKYGIKVLGGYILTGREITEVGNQVSHYVIHEVELKKTIPQKSIGIFAKKKFGWLYAEGNLLYTNYGMLFNVTSYVTPGGPHFELKETFGYVDLQIMGGITSNNFRIGVGPMVHILASHSSELTGLENYIEKLRKVSYGFSGSIGYDVGRFSFDIKYDKAFRTVGDHIYYGDKQSLFLETPDALTLGVSYTIWQ